MSRDMQARERLWHWMRSRRKGFTTPDAIKACRISATGARRFVSQLSKAGILTRLDDEIRKSGQRVARYRLAVDPGPALPCGTVIGGSEDSRRNDGMMQAIWDAVRIAGRFDWDGLLLVLEQGGASYTENGVRLYLQQVLVRGGYVTDSGPSGPGRCKAYRVQRDTGPRAPVRRHRGIWDHNLCKQIELRSEEAANA